MFSGHGPLFPSLDNLNYYKHLLEISSTFEQWHAAAHQLDRLEGNEQWKDDPVSPDFEYKLIINRLSQLCKARESGDVNSMIFLLRTSLSRNIGDIGNPALYRKTRVGTKKIIEDYMDEVIRQLNLISEAPEYHVPIPSLNDRQDLEDHSLVANDDYQSPVSNLVNQDALDLEEKLEFFLNTRQSFGRTALLLSGGATLGLNHIGVIKALHECQLLPRIISGSSVGSLIAALVCSKTDHELFDYLNDDSLNLNALESVDEEGTLFFKLARFIKHGVIFDVEVLKNCIRSNIGDVTFQEAYNRTRRILNITVSSSTQYEMPRLLNYLTAPNVLIWSAVAASCAIPFIYKSAPLMARDKLGNIVPWNPSGHRWIDGSVENDLPMMRLSELFNVNHFIVSQVNPHVVPFLSHQKSGGGSTDGRLKLTGFLAKVFYFVGSEINHRISQLIELDIFPTALHRVQNILSQKYSGDITIVPDVNLTDYLQLISNPTKETLWDAVIKGEKATWPMIGIIKNHCSVELALDDIIYRLRIRKLDANLTSMLRSSQPNISNESALKSLTSTQSSLIAQSENNLEESTEIVPLMRSSSVGRGMNMHKFFMSAAINDSSSKLSDLDMHEIPFRINLPISPKPGLAISADEFSPGSEICFNREQTKWNHGIVTSQSLQLERLKEDEESSLKSKSRVFSADGVHSLSDPSVKYSPHKN